MKNLFLPILVLTAMILYGCSNSKSADAEGIIVTTKENGEATTIKRINR